MISHAYFTYCIAYTPSEVLVSTVPDFRHTIGRKPSLALEL